jgi:hypothetical protein
VDQNLLAVLLLVLPVMAFFAALMPRMLMGQLMMKQY